MKNIILLLTLVMISKTYAEKVYHKVESGKVVYTTYNKSLCDGCVAVEKGSGFNAAFYNIEDEMVADQEKPVYEEKSNIVTCSEISDNPETSEDETKTKEEDCMAKQAAHSCDLGDGYLVIRDKDNNEVYCTKIVGFKKKKSGMKRAVLDAQKRSEYYAQESLKESEKLELREKIKGTDPLTSEEIKSIFKVFLIGN